MRNALLRRSKFVVVFARVQFVLLYVGVVCSVIVYAAFVHQVHVC